ncbi:tetratricopeptide repeat protein [Aliiroseovarius subalbicans]|uniref:tetratricopeptide repeat protein n=1 Tax=Aliiroseovarius subalbicans TaxID=2925840 RepID=UPI001F58B621|nr:tetratricopeptide repeat protein [Aliiroseovarius subalbicans]MCI2400413.1 tetratricopeptide repeat protein [Aliiroseovarius subalbicans]
MRLKLFVLVSMLATAGCENVDLGDFSSTSDSAESVQDTSNVSYYPNDQLIVSGKAHFAEGNYGKAYRSFEKAIDVAPQDPQAWLGFAASSDMLRRFDKSDFAYKKLQPVIGNRIEFLNNYGYSHLLRGNLTTARALFLKAYEIDPSNEFAATNLQLLRNSVNYQRRSPGDLSGI